MSTDLVSVGTAAEIAELPPADAAAFVTHALVESKAWLGVATKGTDPTPIADFKAWAAGIAEMTRQKQLASEIQADALEMVRRAERGIGVAVRNGQAAGEVRAKGHSSGGPRADYLRGDRPVHVDRDVADSQMSPKKFLPNGKDLCDVYAMTDGVSDEQFDDAVADAREEGNLSRANVVRKIKGQQSHRTRGQLADEIAALASSGHASAQIARKVNVGEEWVRRTARDYGIEIPADKVVGKTRRIDSIRIARETVTTLDGIAATVDLVTDLSGLDPREAQQWTASLTESIRALNRLKKRIEAVQ